jgi:hypothetical protein
MATCGGIMVGLLDRSAGDVMTVGSRTIGPDALPKRRWR